MSTIHGSIMNELTRTLGRLSRSTAIAASNVANVDTPGYRAQQVEFSAALGEASLKLEKTRAGHLTSRETNREGRVSDAPVTRARPDGNTVDIDREMTQLSTLGGRFTATAQMLRRHIALLRYAATDGKQ